MTGYTTPIETCRLEDGDVAVSILSYGAITQGWWVPCDGQSVPVVLGLSDPEQYRHDNAYLGAIAGRIANRTAGGRFTLDGETYQLTQNESANHLHGGAIGLHRRHWTMERDSQAQAVQLSTISPDGEDGYPGTATITVTIALAGQTLTYAMEAHVDRPTPINLAQHNYYSLMGSGPIWDHHLTSPADRMTPTDPRGIPTGEIASVAGSPLDFREGARFGAQDPNHQGTDLNLVLPEGLAHDTPMAEVRAPNGLRLRLWSDQPGFQLYTGGHLPTVTGAHAGQVITAFSGFCLEPQGFPNAINTPAFPSIVVTPETPYRQTTRIEIGAMP